MREKSSIFAPEFIKSNNIAYEWIYRHPRTEWTDWTKECLCNELADRYGAGDSRAETLILPTDVHFIPKFVAGFSYVKNFVVPAKLAPIVSWGGDYTPWYGTRQSIYDYCINLVSNCYGTFGSGVSNKSERNLYVLDGTSSEKASWTD